MNHIKRIVIIAAIGLAGLCHSAHAGGGTVLAIDGDDIYIDMGASDGLGTGSTLTLLHVIVAKNPTTGKTIRDRFPLGQLTVVKTGEAVSVARAAQDIKHRIKVGDEIELASQPRRFIDPWIETIAARRTERKQRIKAREAARAPRTEAARIKAREAEIAKAEAQIAAAEAVKKVWESTLGKAPEARIAAWQRFLQNTPRTPYEPAIRQEIASLNAQIQAEQQVTQELVDPASRRAQMRVARLAALVDGIRFQELLAVAPPARVYEGTAVDLSFTLLSPNDVARGWLYYRSGDEGSYHRIELSHDGDAYMRGTIPASATTAAGVQYFVETASAADDAPVAAIGSQAAPWSLEVEAKVEEEAPNTKDRSRITLFTDYVDFDGRLGGGFDQYIHAEIDFMYRFYKPIYAVRVGFGTLGGMGGPKDVIDDHPDDCIDDIGNYQCRRVTFSYAYTEFEFRLSRNLAFMLRPQFGSGTSDSQPNTNSGRCDTEDISDCELFTAAGLLLKLRIGEEQATNLTLSAGATENVGTLLEAAFTWDVIPRFPIKLSAQVTDQPVPEDYGVRIIADVGYRALKWVYPSVRLAYQARDVDHAGLSGGVAVNFDW